jgi:hypothetical protein
MLDDVVQVETAQNPAPSREVVARVVRAVASLLNPPPDPADVEAFLRRRGLTP